MKFQFNDHSLVLLQKITEDPNYNGLDSDDSRDKAILTLDVQIVDPTGQPISTEGAGDKDVVDVPMAPYQEYGIRICGAWRAATTGDLISEIHPRKGIKLSFNGESNSWTFITVPNSNGTSDMTIKTLTDNGGWFQLLPLDGNSQARGIADRTTPDAHGLVAVSVISEAKPDFSQLFGQRFISENLDFGSGINFGGSMARRGEERGVSGFSQQSSGQTFKEVPFKGNPRQIRTKSFRLVVDHSLIRVPAPEN